MAEGENQYMEDSLLIEAYELTGNRWNCVSVGDLYKALLYRLENDRKGRRNWIRWESRDAKRQLEVIHLLLLIDSVDEVNLRLAARQLQTLLPDESNSIQPIYVPSSDNEDPGIIIIGLNDGSQMRINYDSFLFESSTEV